MTADMVSLFSSSDVCRMAYELLVSPKYDASIVQPDEFFDKLYLQIITYNAVMNIYFQYDSSNSELTIAWSTERSDTYMLFPCFELYMATTVLRNQANYCAKCGKLVYKICDERADMVITTWSTAMHSIEHAMLELKKSLEADPNYMEILLRIIRTDYNRMKSDINSRDHDIQLQASQYDTIMQHLAKTNRQWKPEDILHVIETDPFTYVEKCPFKTLTYKFTVIKTYVKLYAQSLL